MRISVGRGKQLFFSILKTDEIPVRETHVLMQFSLFDFVRCFAKMQSFCCNTFAYCLWPEIPPPSSQKTLGKYLSIRRTWCGSQNSNIRKQKMVIFTAVFLPNTDFSKNMIHPFFGSGKKLNETSKKSRS